MINTEKIEHLIKELLEALGEDPQRPELRETPKRVAKMYKEICSGLEEPPTNLIKVFKEKKIKCNLESEIIEINDIPVYSICEHHLLPFFGKANIKYIPENENIMGLSKVGRVVDYFSKKPQVQERLTAEIATFLYDNLHPISVQVTLECSHLCMMMRGSRAHGSITKTTFTCKSPKMEIQEEKEEAKN